MPLHQFIIYGFVKIELGVQQTFINMVVDLMDGWMDKWMGVQIRPNSPEAGANI
jgi:hypothetical protein